MHQQKFACYDLFDTVLFRAVLAPSDVFRLIHRKLLKDGIVDEARIGEDAFVAARRCAETKARVGVEECTLDEIWTLLAADLGSDCATLGVKLEEEAERQVLYPNAEIVNLLRKQRAKGETIVFISDMYHSTKFLKSVLIDLGIWENNDHIFVSSCEGAQKHTGRLYTKVRAALGGNPRSYRMTGDNRRSDVLRARLAGWRARHYRGQQLNRYERTLLQKLNTTRLQKSVLVGTIRRFRCADQSHRTSRFVSDFLGLVAMFWALWAIRQAQAQGVHRLKFAARDGYQAWVAAEALHNLGVTSVKCDYFYSSRASLYFANINNFEEDLDWIANQSEELTAKKVYQYLNLDTDAIKTSLPANLTELDALSADDYRALKENLLQSGLAEHVIDAAANQRALVLKFLEQEHMMSDEVWAIADIGWHLNVQAQIANIAGVDRTRGLYLYLSEKRQPPSSCGVASAMLPTIAEDAKVESIPSIWRYTTIAEHLLSMAPHGTTTGYAQAPNGTVVPVCKNINETEREGKEAIATEVRKFVTENGAEFAVLFDSDQSCTEALRQITNVFIDHPTRDALKGLPGLLSVGRGMRNEGDKKLLQPIGFLDILNAVLVILRIRRRGNFEWLHGRLVMTGPMATIGIHISNFLRRGS